MTLPWDIVQVGLIMQSHELLHNEKHECTHKKGIDTDQWSHVLLKSLDMLSWSLPSHLEDMFKLLILAIYDYISGEKEHN